MQHLKKLRWSAAVFILILPAIILYSFKSQIAAYSDFWQQLGITEKDGSEKIRESFLNGYLQYYGVRNFKNIALDDRKAVATDLLNYTKKYVQSSDFKKAYELKRQNMKPREVTRQPRTEDQIRQDLIAKAKKEIDKIEKSLKAATQENIKKIYQDSYDRQKKQLEEYQKPDNRTIAMMANGEKAQYEQEIKRYAEKMKNWEADYPADPSLFVKKRLQEVLTVTAGIDYNAELMEKNKKKVFVNPEYEKKPLNWKAGFRAGKEVTETVRTLVQQWMQEL